MRSILPRVGHAQVHGPPGDVCGGSGGQARRGVRPWYALLETRGRASGRPRRTPVGDGLRGDGFWIVFDHGFASGYVKKIQRDPRVRVRTHGRWRSGIATLLTVRIALRPVAGTTGRST